MRARAVSPIVMHSTSLMISLAALLVGCESAPKTNQRSSQSSPSPSSPSAPSRPLTPEAQRALSAISRLSPENALAWLKRSESAPSSPKADTMIVAPIETWSQPGVGDGYMRQMSFDPKTSRFWIIESGGISGRTHWYGPVMLDANGALLNVD